MPIFSHCAVYAQLLAVFARNMGAVMLRCGMFGMLLCRNVGSHPPLLRYIERQNKVTGRNAKVNREFSMAYNNTISHSNVPTIKAPFAVIGGFFAAIWTGLVNMGANSGRMRQVTFLQSKTDEELSAMGIKRDEIVHHVFRDTFYV